MSTITETCACGASFTAVEHYPSDARKAADEWREGHKHAEARALREAAEFCESTVRNAIGALSGDYADGWRNASDNILAELNVRADRIGGAR